MNWFDKIKSMNEKELVEFLVDFDINKIDEDFCKNHCTERNKCGICKHDKDCKFDDSFVIEKWFHTKANEN